MFVSKWTLAVLAAAVLGLSVGLAYLAGQQSGLPEPQAKVQQPIKWRIIEGPTTENSAPKAVTQRPPQPEQSTPAQLTLASIKDSDWKQLGMGCSCSFSTGKAGREVLIAGGDDLAILRPNSSRRVCPLSEDHLQKMFDDNVTIKCGQSRISVRGQGKVKPGFDGHSTAAKLTVNDGGAQEVFNGTWGCGC